MGKYSFEKVDRFLQSMIVEKQIPGAVYAVINESETLAIKAIGLAHIEEKISMKEDTLFDLASLTKVCATLPCIFKLIEEGLLDFDDTVQRFFPQMKNSQLTIRHLLTHTSGFCPSFPFYQYQWSKTEILNYILSKQTDMDKAVVYSDLNFILLGFIVEKITQEPLDKFARESIYQPLGMMQTTFCPNKDLRHIAPTEWLDKEHRYCWGIVHDENARYLNGVSGHAGLFSNVPDLITYVRMLLNNGMTANGNYFFSPILLKTSWRNFTDYLNLNRGLGWQLKDSSFSTAGYLASNHSFGHTGFTGTSFWIDPQAKIATILLTNRVHISRTVNMNRIRRIFHNLVFTEISKKE